MNNLDQDNFFSNVRVDDYVTGFMDSEEIRCQDINKVFGKGKTLYLTNFFDSKAAEIRGVGTPESNSAQRKKELLFDKIEKKFKILSISKSNSMGSGFYLGSEGRDVIHTPIIRANKLNLLTEWFFVFLYLIKYRKFYDNILFYNYYPYSAIPALLAKFFLKKSIYIDYEDGYFARSGWYDAKITEKLVATFLDGAILINESLKRRVPTENFAIVNSFANLSYSDSKVSEVVKKVKKNEKINLVYSGSIDKIRGADLLEEFSNQLSERNISHEIKVTGFGERVDKIIPSDNSNINYLGFLSKSELDVLLEEADIGLEFQKPDHKFSKSSFPSKVGLYSRHFLPILTLHTLKDAEIKS